METWLSPFASVWHQHYPESVVPFKQLAQALKPLKEAHPVERIVNELGGYLKATPAQFVNLRKFAATFGIWTPKVVPEKPAAPLGWYCVNHPDRQTSIKIGRTAYCAECRDTL